MTRTAKALFICFSLFLSACQTAPSTFYNNTQWQETANELKLNKSLENHQRIIEVCQERLESFPDGRTNSPFRYLVLRLFLANAHIALGRHKTAQVILDDSVPLAREKLTEQHPLFVNILESSAINSGILFQYEKSKKQLEELIEISEKSDPPFKQALAINNLSIHQMHVRDYTNATSTYEKSVALVREVNDPKALILFLNQQALALEYADRLDSSAEVYYESISLIEKLYSPQSPSLSLPEFGLARIALSKGQTAKAKRLIQSAHQRMVLITDDADEMHIGNQLAYLNTISESGNFIEIESSLRKLYAKAIKLESKLSPGTVEIQYSLARHLSSGEKSDEALELSSSAVQGAKSISHKHPLIYPIALYQMAQIQLTANRLAEAEGSISEAKNSAEATSGKHHKLTLGTKYLLAKIKQAQGKLTESEKIINSLISDIKAEKSDKTGALILPYKLLSEIYETTHRNKEREGIKRKIGYLVEEGKGPLYGETNLQNYL